MKTYESQNFNRLLGTPGFSDTLFKNHFTLYEGYVKNANMLSQELEDLFKTGKTTSPMFAELKRRFGWEFNGMRLHELYFGNMTKEKMVLDPASDFLKKIDEVFGGYEFWEKEFKATGTMRGIGWTILYYDPIGNHLFNVWTTEHEMGHLAGCTPLLVLDVFEHAYVLDYGLKRADYIETFMAAIDWNIVNQRFSR